MRTGDVPIVRRLSAIFKQKSKQLSDVTVQASIYNGAPRIIVFNFLAKIVLGIRRIPEETAFEKYRDHE